MADKLPASGAFHPRWKPENRERNASILRWREEGWTLAAIGRDVGLSVERVRSIILEHERWLRRISHPPTSAN